jgi:hypothetical protein
VANHASPAPDTQGDPPRTSLGDHLAYFERRLLADAINTATGAYWLRRAKAFEDAKPRPDDYRGNATDADLRAAWTRCDAAAKACRARANVAPADDVRGEVEDALRDAA